MSRSADNLRAAQRHEKLRDLMCAKVQKLLAGVELTDAQQSFIQQEVDALLHSGDATEGSLHHIAAQLRKLVQPQQRALSTQPSAPTAAPKEKRSTPQPPTQPIRSVVDAQRVANAAVSAPAPLKAPLLAAAAADDLDGEDDLYSSKHRVRVPRPQEVHADDWWALLAKKGLEEYNEQIISQRRTQKRKEIEQSKFLDQQVALRKEQHIKRVQDERRFAEEERRQTERFYEEEKKIQEKMKLKLIEERKSRDQQLEEARARHEKEARQREIEKQQAVKIIEEELAKEQAAAEERRLKAKIEVKKFEQFNEQFQQIKKAERSKERDLDKKHQEMYLARLAKDEAERERALREMQDKQHRQQALAFQLQATVAEKAAEDERKAQAYAAAVDAKKQEEERRKREKAAADRLKFKQYITIQMLDHEKQHQQEQELLRKEREEVLRQAQLAEQEAEERKRLERQKKLQQRQTIEEQVTYRNSIRRDVFMSETERALNAKLLSRVVSPSH